MQSPIQLGRILQSSVPLSKYEQQEPPPILVLEPIQFALGLRPMNLVETLEPETWPPNALGIVTRSFSLRERTAFDAFVKQYTRRTRSSLQEKPFRDAASLAAKKPPL